MAQLGRYYVYRIPIYFRPLTFCRILIVQCIYLIVACSVFCWTISKQFHDIIFFNFTCQELFSIAFAKSLISICPFCHHFINFITIAANPVAISLLVLHQGVRTNLAVDKSTHDSRLNLMYHPYHSGIFYWQIS